MSVLTDARIALIYGTTNSSADTAMTTKPENPFGHGQCVAVTGGEGVYIEDDGSRTPFQSGVTASTIDVRSSGTSTPFVVLLLELGATDPLSRTGTA